MNYLNQLKDIEMVNKIFWIARFEGKAKGGYFIRNGLAEFIKKIEDQGEKVVALKVDDSFNLEVIVEDKTPNDDTNNPF